MHKRRSLFVTGVLLSALVLFGVTGAQAQGTDPAPAIQDSLDLSVLGYDSMFVSWTVLDDAAQEDTTEIEIAWVATEIGETVAHFEALDPDGSETVPKGRSGFSLDGLTFDTKYLVGVRTLNDNSETEAAKRARGLSRTRRRKRLTLRRR